MNEVQEAGGTVSGGSGPKPRAETVRLLGRDIPVVAADDGTLRAEDDGNPASTKSVASYLARAFGTSRPRIGMPWRPVIGSQKSSRR